MTSTTEIAKMIRNDLKEMKGFKFSVRSEYFANGSSIDLHIMKSPIRIKRTMEEIPEINNSQRYTIDEIEKLQNESYHQLNHNFADEEYNIESWNNGVFLTQEGHDIIKKVVDIVGKYHWAESDSQIDYFNTNFYYHLELGKYDKEFIDG